VIGDNLIPPPESRMQVFEIAPGLLLPAEGTQFAEYCEPS
jgi:hypothetical protein